MRESKIAKTERRKKNKKNQTCFCFKKPAGSFNRRQILMIEISNYNIYEQ